MSTDSILTAATSHPVVVGAFTALLGIVTYAYQSFRVRQTDRAERRRILYEALVEQVFKLLSARPGEETSRVITAIEKSWLFASDDVLKACYQVFDVYAEVTKGMDQESQSLKWTDDSLTRFEQAVAMLFVAMRADLLGNWRTSRIDEEWARAKVRVFRSGATSSVEPRRTL